VIKSLELKGPSCLTSARDDEPIFVLRANDEIAPLVVRFWATQYFKFKSKLAGGMTPTQKAKMAEALQLADHMHRWREKSKTGVAKVFREVADAIGTIGRSGDSIEKIDVSGEARAQEPQRIGSEVLSGCAVRAAQQIAKADRIEVSAKQFEAMQLVCRLASELCDSVDAAEQDIGGHRASNEILADLGPAVAAYKGR
jgi:hypothetical protein